MAVWLALVIAVSISPLSFKLKLHTVGAYHDFGHYAVYTVTALLLWLAGRHWFGRMFTFSLGVGLAFAQEWAENKLYHAGFEWRDIGTDLAGLVSGYALMVMIVTLMTDEGAPGRRYPR